jgi:hypothetical protein
MELKTFKEQEHILVDIIDKYMYYSEATVKLLFDELKDARFSIEELHPPMHEVPLLSLIPDYDLTKEIILLGETFNKKSRQDMILTCRLSSPESSFWTTPYIFKGIGKYGYLYYTNSLNYIMNFNEYLEENKYISALRPIEEFSISNKYESKYFILQTDIPVTREIEQKQDDVIYLGTTKDKENIIHLGTTKDKEKVTVNKKLSIGTNNNTQN